VQSIMQLSFAAFGMVALPLGMLAEVITLRWTIAVMGAVAFLASAVYWSLEMVVGSGDDVDDRGVPVPTIEFTSESRPDPVVTRS
jgi:hypothetical protein